MHRHHRFVVFGVPLALAAITAVAGGASRRLSLTGTQPRESFQAREIRSVQAHFDSVLRELHTAVPMRLTSAQTAGRERLIVTLQGYRDRAQFPRNYDFDEETPYFVDRKTGTRCAVAYLLESTMRHDLVDRIATTNNNVRAADLYADTAFVSWLDQHGLTVADAARIQPSYPGDGGTQGLGVITYIAVGTVIATVATTVATSVGLTAWNLTGNRSGRHKKAAVFGLGFGLGTTLLGGALAAHGTQGGETQIGLAGGAVGVVGMVAAANALSNRTTRDRATKDTVRAAPRTVEYTDRGGVTTTISPLVPFTRMGGAGVVVSLRF